MDETDDTQYNLVRLIEMDGRGSLDRMSILEDQIYEADSDAVLFNDMKAMVAAKGRAGLPDFCDAARELLAQHKATIESVPRLFSVLLGRVRLGAVDSC